MHRTGVPPPELTLLSAVALVVGQVIAVGIFLTPGTLIRTVASPFWILVVWIVIGAMAVSGAVCYGALAARYPQSGGGYVYLRETYGPGVAFVYGWKCLLVMDPGVTAALATGFASYVSYIAPLGNAARRGVAIAAILGLALVHVAGVRPGARLLTGLSVTKIVLILGLVVAAFGSASGTWANASPFFERHALNPPLLGGLAGGLVAAFFSFGGWWEVTKIAGEVHDAPRTVRRALLIGLVVITALYIAATLAFVYVIPIEAVRPGEAFVAQVGEAVFGQAGASAVAVVVLVCVLGSLGTILMLAPRVYWAMARDGLFPAAAAELSPRFGTPARAILIQAALASILVALGTFDTIVAYFVFVTVAFIMLTVAGVYRLRGRDPGFRVPGSPWSPLVFLTVGAVLLTLLALNNPLQAALGTAIVAAGVPVYRRISAIQRAPLR